jgi:uncharacterized HAD superfamily protein
MSDVLVDVDDTVADTQLFLIDKINGLTGGSYEFDSMTRGHRENAAEHREWNENVWALMKQAHEWSVINPSDGAAEAFIRLVHEGVTPHIVTARKSHLFEVTDRWLQEHGFYFHGIQVHRRGDAERGSEFKCRVAEEVGFDAAFEDTLDVALDLSDYVETIYLIDKPWNRIDDLPENIVRVESFSAGVDRFLG